MDWQSIDTAPKDRVIVVWDDWNQRPKVCFWFSGPDEWLDLTGGYYNCEPTHWIDVGKPFSEDGETWVPPKEEE